MKPVLFPVLMTALSMAQVASSKCSADLPTVDLGYQVHQAWSFDSNTRLYKFSNIPYAEPPIGPLRFRAPQPPSWNTTSIQRGQVDKICPQTSPDWQPILPLPDPNDPDFTEDCLVLDIVVPKAVFDGHDESENRSKGAPVVIWIHGGAFVFGHKAFFGSPDGIISASQSDGSPGIIWVAINYRLGAFGWLGGPLMQSDGTANAGFHDQRLAIAWVRDHIAKFGGDKDNITIMGESAGGASVMHQLSAFGGEQGADFHKAVAQSAGFYPVPDKKTHDAQVLEFLDRLSVSSIEEARRLPSSKLIEVNYEMIRAADHGSYEFGPTIDDSFVPADPSQLFLEDRYATDIPILSSYTADEGAMFNNPNVTEEADFAARVSHYYSEISSDDLDYVVSTLYPPMYDGSKGYTSMAERYNLVISELLFTCHHDAMMQSAHRNGVRSFGYRFSIPPALHGSDLPYTFYPSGGDVLGNRTTHLIQSGIASFVKTGDPNIAGVRSGPVFPAYDARSSILDLNLTEEVIRDPSRNERCAFRQRAF